LRWTDEVQGLLRDYSGSEPFCDASPPRKRSARNGSPHRSLSRAFSNNRRGDEFNLIVSNIFQFLTGRLTEGASRILDACWPDAF
jgi:hypothetical protein